MIIWRHGCRHGHRDLKSSASLCLSEINTVCLITEWNCPVAFVDVDYLDTVRIDLKAQTQLGNDHVIGSLEFAAHAVSQGNPIASFISTTSFAFFMFHFFPRNLPHYARKTDVARTNNIRRIVLSGSQLPTKFFRFFESRTRFHTAEFR